MATTQISDVFVPEVFDSYVQLLTEEKSNIIASGALVRSTQLDERLAGGGLTFNSPSFNDLGNDAENISGDDEDDSFTGGAANSTPKKTSAVNEVAVRLSRNNSWSTADLTEALAGADALSSIIDRVATYRALRLQAAFIATMAGVFADNDAAPVGTEHVIGDLTNDIRGVAYSAGVTDFGANPFIDALLTAGDSMGGLSLTIVHPIVFGQMQKKNLIEFIPDARGEIMIPTYLGRAVTYDDACPSPELGVYETWLFGAGAALLGMGEPRVPSEFARNPDSGNGGGSEIIYHRWEQAIHPSGHSYVGTPANGGPSNLATTNNLSHADSFQRVYPERKQIRIARLITREF